MATPTNALIDAQIAQMLEAATATPDEGAGISYRLGNQTFKAKDPADLQAQLDAAMQQIASGVQQQLANVAQQAQARPASRRPRRSNRRSTRRPTPSCSWTTPSRLRSIWTNTALASSSPAAS